ncbi:MAG: hypothetical protein M1816_001823 [Peltula sp. TS41687]|nr:MAG: hypothetical protein M1816_001823 [Peltula sp. TS41687]
MGPSQQALVRLEQSQEPSEEQLIAACHILQLDPSSLESVERCEDEISRIQRTTIFLGREQWILRWLLGRFQAKGNAGASVRSEPKAWRLLELLMHRIPLAIVARYLNTHKYLEFFHETLQDALETESFLDGNTSRHRSSSAGSMAGSSTDNTHELSESSNALTDSPAISPTGTSRKRKSSEISTSASQEQDLLEKMTAVFRVLHKLLAWTKNKPLWQHLENVRYESEYVKSVLRSEPAAAAKSLGLSFELIDAMLKANGKKPVHARHDGDISVIRDISEDLLDLWNHRSGMIDDVEGNASNDVLSKTITAVIVDRD